MEIPDEQKVLPVPAFFRILIGWSLVPLPVIVRFRRDNRASNSSSYVCTTFLSSPYRYSHDPRSTLACAFQYMKSFLNKLRPGSQEETQYLGSQREIPIPSILLKSSAPSITATPNILPKPSPTPSITTTPTSVESNKRLPELPSRQVSPIQHRPHLESAGSSTAVSSSSSPAQSNHPAFLVPKPASVQQIVQNRNSGPITSHTSWSKFTESDLVANINSRERTRQELLFEIVASEEKYDDSFKSPFRNFTDAY